MGAVDEVVREGLAHVLVHRVHRGIHDVVHWREEVVEKVLKRKVRLDAPAMSLDSREYEKNCCQHGG